MSTRFVPIPPFYLALRSASELFPLGVSIESVYTLIISSMHVRDFIHLINASSVSEEGNYKIKVCMTQLCMNVGPQSFPS